MSNGKDKKQNDSPKNDPSKEVTKKGVYEPLTEGYAPDTDPQGPLPKPPTGGTGEKSGQNNSD